MNAQNNRLLVMSQKDEPILMKTQHLIHIIIFRAVSYDRAFLHLFFHTSSDWTQPTLSVRRLYFCSWLRGWLQEDPTYGNKILSYAIQTGEPSVDCEKFSVIPSLRTSGPLTRQIAIPLIIMCGAWLSKRPTKLHEISKMNWRQG